MLCPRPAPGLGALRAGCASCGKLQASPRRNATNPLSPEPTALSGQSEARHPFLSERGAVARRYVRSEAVAGEACRPVRIENLTTERKTGAAFPHRSISKVWTERDRSQRPVRADGPAHDESPSSARCMRRSEPRTVAHVDELRRLGAAPTKRGAWVALRHGLRNQNLPGFIAMCPNGYPIKDAENWQSGFLPGVYQGTFIDSQHRQLDG